MATKARAALQTFHALQASDIAAAFNQAMQRVRIHPGDYRAELTAPEGPSTGGGVQAMQHIRLLSQDPALPTLVAGSANHAEERAELRTFEHLDAVHWRRFKKPIAIDRAQYDAFLRLAKQILEVLHMKTTVSGPPVDVDSEPGGSRGRGWMIFAGFLVVLAGGAAVLWRLGMMAPLLKLVPHG
jgi:hypothetical protein